MKRILFVCVENSNRSQMAEAFARRHGGAHVEVYSAGSRPSGRVNPRAVEFMCEVDCDLTQHTSKSLADLPDLEFDVAVTMGCGMPARWCERSAARSGRFQTRRSCRPTSSAGSAISSSKE